MVAGRWSCSGSAKMEGGLVESSVSEENTPASIHLPELISLPFGAAALPSGVQKKAVSFRSGLHNPERVLPFSRLGLWKSLVRLIDMHFLMW